MKSQKFQKKNYPSPRDLDSYFKKFKQIGQINCRIKVLFDSNCNYFQKIKFETLNL